MALLLAGDDARLEQNQVWRQFQYFEIGFKLIHSVPAIRIAERTTEIYYYNESFIPQVICPE